MEDNSAPENKLKVLKHYGKIVENICWECLTYPDLYLLCWMLCSAFKLFLTWLSWVVFPCFPMKLTVGSPAIDSVRANYYAQISVKSQLISHVFYVSLRISWVQRRIVSQSNKLVFTRACTQGILTCTVWTRVKFSAYPLFFAQALYFEVGLYCIYWVLFWGKCTCSH